MNGTTRWWQQESAYFLNETLAFINASRKRDEVIGRCDDLCRALNKTWNAFLQYQIKHNQISDSSIKHSDNQSFKSFMLQGITDQQASLFCESDSVRWFAKLTPQIMDHGILLKNRYDPFNITEDVRRKASKTHQKLLEKYDEFSQLPTDPSLKEALLKETKDLIYIVRSNIAHSEKTPQGPDLAKSERDRLVSEVTAKVIDDLFDILFDRPSERLAVYGTLSPGGPNESELASLESVWHDGTVQGVIEQRDGFQEFKWVTGAQLVSVKVISANNLSAKFDRLDRFEGPRYQRVLVPVKIEEELSICNIYQAKKHD